MKLFRRLLLSFFPTEIIHQQMSPGNMFVTFISPKQFFGVVNRRIVENYKLNLFDISLDPFEAKIGFGERPTLNVKDVDFYFAYDATANLNGWMFYAPTNLATMISIVMAVSTKKIFKKEKYPYFSAFSITIFLLTFVFASRIKVFPYTDKEKNYKRFIDVFFNFYEETLKQFGEKKNKKTIERIKKGLLQEIHLFFMLFYFYHMMGKLFISNQLSNKEFYQWFFHDDLKKGKAKTWVKDFVLHASKYTKLTTFSPQDSQIMRLVFPADILVKYLLSGEESFLIVDKLLTGLFDKDTLSTYLRSFLKGNEKFEEFLHYIMDWRLFKKNYFKGIKKLSMHAFSLKGKYDYNTEKEIDSFISSLGDASSLDEVKIPEKLSAESAMMERLVNFYVTHLGGLWIGRGDNFYLRLFKKPLIDKLVNVSYKEHVKQEVLYYYGALLYTYTKNTFYYQYAYDNIKAGKDVFNLPLKPSSKEVQSNMFILKLFYENSLNILLQDINKKSVKIYINNKKILKLFQKAFAKEISQLVSFKKMQLLHALYDDTHFFLQNMPDFFDLLDTFISKQNIKIIKENLYSMDIQLWLKATAWLVNHEIMLSEDYGDMTMLGIISSMRETLFGFLLWYMYIGIEAKDAKTDLKKESLKRIYIIDVLNLSLGYYEAFSHMLDDLLATYEELLQKRIYLDDNQKYFSIGLGNRLSFIEGKDDEQIATEVMGEDIIRFRGYLKTISYYNKRYVIPK